MTTNDQRSRIKFTDPIGKSSADVQRWRERSKAEALSLFKCFREADLAAAAAERIVLSARANVHKGGAWASHEQIQLAATLRVTADQIFRLTMCEWEKLEPPPPPPR